jgi:hypothetical protein
MKKEEQKILNIRQDIRNNPNFAQMMELARNSREVCIQELHNKNTSLTTKGLGDVFDKLVEEVAEEKGDKAAAKMMRNDFEPEVLLTLLGARGDLDSTAARLADIDVIWEAILLELETVMTENELPRPFHMVLLANWAVKLSGYPISLDYAHDGYDEFLFFKLAGIPVWKYLYSYSYYGKKEEIGEEYYLCDFVSQEDIDEGVVDDLGFDVQSVQKAQRRFVKHRKNIEDSPVEVQEAREAVDSDMDAL